MSKCLYLFLAAAIGFWAFAEPHTLVGLWRSNGNAKVVLEFKENGNFKVTVDGHVENEGRYEFGQDVFTMYDGNCGLTMPGKYKINFFTPDSAAFSVLADSCKDRVGEVNGGTIIRIK